MPETGRWRFMNTSPKFEVEVWSRFLLGRCLCLLTTRVIQFAELSRKEYRAEFEHATLPSTHPLTRRVRHVVSRILSASNLGVVRGDSSDNPIPTLPFVQGKDGYPSNSSTNTLGSTVEWDVIVVNDRRVINALATPGNYPLLSLSWIFKEEIRINCRLHGHSSTLSWWRGIGSRPCSWWVLTSISKRHYLNSFPPRDRPCWLAKLFFQFFLLAHYNSVARHTAELISLQSPILLFQSLLQRVRSAPNSAGAIPQIGLQVPNSQVQEHEGRACM